MSYIGTTNLASFLFECTLYKINYINYVVVMYMILIMVSKDTFIAPIWWPETMLRTGNNNKVNYSVIYKRKKNS